MGETKSFGPQILPRQLKGIYLDNQITRKSRFGNFFVKQRWHPLPSYYLMGAQDVLCLEPQVHFFSFRRRGKTSSRCIMMCLKPQVCFFLLLFFFFYTNKYLVIGYGYEWRRQQGKEKGSRRVITHLQPFVCFFFFLL